MSYILAIGDRSYSSWSLRGWLIFGAFDIPVEVELLRMYTDSFREGLKPYAPGRTVPSLLGPDGILATDTLAIAETVAERHPEAGHWPKDPGARSRARSMVAEMHSGFGALRSACAMDITRRYSGFEPDEKVRADLARLEQLWSARQGKFLFGTYTLADAFFTPVATRVYTYRLPLGAGAQEYVDNLLSHPAFLRWKAEAKDTHVQLSNYDRDLPFEPWA